MPVTPIIETERLRLRGHRPEDLHSCAVMWGTSAVTRHIGGRPFTREEVWARLLRYAGHWTLLGFGFWLIEEKATGEFVGEAGLAEFERDIDPPIRGIPEAGWILIPRFHGRGYATEAMQAVLAWHGDSKTVCLIHPANAASLRVAEKCGYEEFARSTYHGEPVIILSR